MPIIHLVRLDATIKAGGVAIDGVDLNGNVSPSNLQAQAQPIINAFDDSDAAQAVFDNANFRTAAIAQLDNDREALLKLLRAAAAIMVDEINVLREWEVSFKAAVAAATNLANLQTRVAALPDLPDRTLAQAITAIKNKINGGTVD